MKKTILEIYALAVCFTTIVCATVALGIALWNIIEITKPDFTINGYTYERHQDNEAFGPGNGCSNRAAATAQETGLATVVTPPADDPECKPLSEAELTAKREASWAKVLSSERRGGVQSLLRCLIVVALDILIFTVHWILARRARQSPA